MQKKPLRVAALCLLCLLLPAVPLAAQDDGYVEIGENSYGTYSLYIPSVETREHYSGDYVVGWIRTVYSDTGATEYAKNGVKPHHSMLLVAANPKSRQIQTISVTYYDSEGRVIDSDSYSFNQFMWEECVPGTSGERIWEALMIVAGYR